MKIQAARITSLLCLWIVSWSLPVRSEIWLVRSSPTSSQLNGVAYGNGIFVVVGADATILTSPDGAAWTARSLGTRAPMLYCAAYGTGRDVSGQSRYVLGGEEFGLLGSSTDGLSWTNALSTIGIEHVFGITFAYGSFVAVGTGAFANTSLLLTSTNGLDWVYRTIPTTNALLGVVAADGVDGRGWADKLYVAVGERGTILTSISGEDWVVRDSGTTATLRTVAFNGRLVAAGDNGTVLVSSDGVAWSPAAPTSFDVMSLASSGTGGKLVAVGSHSGSGRLQESADGVSWPGTSLAFAQPLNSVAYGAGSFVAVGNAGFIIQSATPVLRFSRTSGGLVLMWDGNFQLGTATSPSGPYAPLPVASSPTTNSFTEPQRYFRLLPPSP